MIVHLYTNQYTKPHYLIIIRQKNLDYACYKCDDAQFKGTLGFVVAEGSGIIQQIIVE